MELEIKPQTDYSHDTDFSENFRAYREYVAANAVSDTAEILNFSDFRANRASGTVQVVTKPENVIEVPEPVETEAVTEEVVTPEPVVKSPEVVAPKAVAKGTPNKWAHEMNGNKYNGVLVVSYNAEMSELKGKAYSNAVCPACGATFTSQSYGIKTGVKTHCGCLRKKNVAEKAA